MYLLISMLYFFIKFYFACVLYQFARRLKLEEEVRQEDTELREEELAAEEAKLEQELEDIEGGNEPKDQEATPNVKSKIKSQGSSGGAANNGAEAEQLNFSDDDNNVASNATGRDVSNNSRASKNNSQTKKATDDIE